MTAREALEARRRRLSPVQLDRFKGRLAGVNPDSGGQPGIQRGGDGAPAPLSSVQERLWFLNEFEPRPDLYNRPANLRLEGSLDRVALRNALREIVRRHDVLRSRITLSVDLPLMELVPDCELTVDERDLRSLPSGEREQEAKRRLNEENLRAFDLAAGPMVRACLIRLEDQEHWLAVTFHHIAFDGWSEGVLWRELGVLYTAFAAGRPSPLPELSLRYADFAVWQRRLLERGGIHSDLAYWRQQLSGAPSLLDLPTDFPRPKRSSNRGGHHPVRIEGALVEALRNLGQREGATLFMTLLAGFQVLLFRLSGQEDVCVGTPIAGRSHPEVEDLIGCFINTLVVRTDLSGNPTFLEVLKRVRGTTLNAYAHQDLPFERLVAELSPRRSLGHAPLFQVMFVFQNAPSARLELGEVSAERLEFESSTAKFDLKLSLGERDGQLRGRLIYSTDLFEAATIERMIGHFHALLEGVVIDPTRTIAALPLATESARRGGTDAPASGLGNGSEAANLRIPSANPSQPNLNDLFEAQLARAPLAEAVIFGAERLTYRELFARADVLADRLRSLGVGPDALVGLCVERSIEMLVGLLGILRAGGAYVPLDPAHPPARLGFLLADTRPRVLVTQEHLRSVLPDHSAHVVCLDPAAEVPAEKAECADHHPLRPDGDSLAYVLHTSGSTGQPKGVQIPRSGLVNLLRSMARQPGMGPQDRMLALTTLGFDIAGLELFLPLVTGGCVVIATREIAADGLALSRFITDSGVNLLQATPATWRMLVEAGWSGDPRLRILCGGEALPFELAKQLLVRCGELWNGYGPTETTIYSILWRVQPDQPIVIGRPIDNTQAYVLDEDRQPVPVGVVGELHLGGAGLARGYLNRPDLTAERFFQYRVTQDTPEVRLYRTGDRVRWLADGRLEYLGRLDHQVKLRGFRIELGEIESVIAAAPGVAANVVTLREDVPGNPRLVAYVVPRTSKDALDTPGLRRHVQAVLPTYMVPALWVVLDALPLSPSGKTDRKALPPPTEFASTESGAPGLFGSPSEGLLAGIWSEVLGVRILTRHDNFFELGGHSLLAMRLAARIREAFGVELPVRTIFEAPSIAQLSDRISLALAGGSALALPPLRAIPRGGILPLSFAQERLWFLDQLEGDSTNYHLTLSLRLRGKLDVDVLERALTEIVSRHEALRTTCGSVDGQPRAVVLDAGRFRLEQTFLRELAATDREIEVQKQATEEVRRPFDLSRDLLLRARCFALGDEDHLLVLTLHHIASDGWSMGIFARELSALYTAFSQGTPSPLPELPLQFLDFAVWQRHWLQGEVLDRQLAYWRTQLAGVPPLLALPTDFPRPTVARHRGGRAAIVLPRDLSRSIHTRSRREGATPFMVLLAAWQTLLARLSGQADVPIGVPIAGRTLAETEGMIGFFANTLVLRSDLSGNPTFRVLLQRVRETTLGAYAHPDLPFEKLVKELRPERSLSHAPLFQVAFTFQNTPDGTLELPSLAIERVHLESATTQFDLTLFLGERDGQFQGELGYDSDLFTPETILRWIGHFQCLLDGIVTDPDRTIDDLPVLTESERAQLLTVWSQPTVSPLPPAGDPLSPPPEDRRPTDWPGLPALFGAQVKRTPDAVALACGDTSLTYGELSTRSLALAQLLRGRGVVRGSSVALYLDRSPDFAVAVLAILHAGGCYVPLPLEYPPARLRFILEDSCAILILSRGPLPDDLCPPGFEVLDLDARSLEGASTNPWIHADSTHEDPGFVDPWIRGCHSQQGADPAYVMYTSGSTGQPKGVVIPHRAVARLVLGQSFAEFGPSLRTLLLAPLAFDASTFEFWAPLLHGGTCVVYPDRNVDPESLERTLRRGRVNCVFLTSALFNQLLDLRPSALEGVAHLLTGGEVISLPHVLKARTLLPRTRLTHCYGPTECTTFATTHAIAPDEEFTHGSVSIGRPIANTTAYVLDARRQPVPIGIPGELYLGGDGLALGYLGQPELTAERFGPDPFGRKTGEEPKETQDSKEGERTAAVLSAPFVPFGHPSASAGAALNERPTTGEPKETQDSKEGERTAAVLSAPFVPFGHPSASAGAALNERPTTGEPKETQDSKEGERTAAVLSSPFVPFGHPSASAGAALNERPTTGEPKETQDSKEGERTAAVLSSPFVPFGHPSASAGAALNERPTTGEPKETQDSKEGERTAAVLSSPFVPFGHPSASAGAALTERPTTGEPKETQDSKEGERTAAVLSSPFVPFGHPSASAGAALNERPTTGEPKEAQDSKEGERTAAVLSSPFVPFGHPSASAGAALNERPTTGEPKETQDSKEGERTAAVLSSPFVPFGHPSASAGAALNERPTTGEPKEAQDSKEGERTAAVLSAPFVPFGHPSASAGAALTERPTTGEPKEAQDSKEGERTAAVLSSPFVPFGHPSASAGAALNERPTTGEPKETQDSKEGERTAAVLSAPFVPFGHPAAPAAPILEARLYRTGDRVRWRADGTLEFLGRMDDQVKIRGHRIEPAEIECALRRHPSVRGAWVVVRAGSDGAKRLAAWCQTAPGTTETAADLRGFLRQSLPEYMIPAMTVSTERVPLTPNGKIDASALSMGSDERTSDTASDPGTTTEAMMADLWCRLLGVRQVGRDENFFDLGGHSLLSLRLLEQIQQVFRTRLAPREFFENPTVRSLSARVWDDMVRPGRSRNHSPDQRLVTLQSGGSLPPIFVFPGGYGDESELITLAWMSRRHLGPGQPLYALLSPGVDGSQPLKRTLAEETRDCLVEMRRVHPRGPWFLIGLCVGGNLAFEVARQLQEAGDAVPMLALADCLQPRRFEYLRSCLRDPGRGPRQYLVNTLYQRTPWMRGLLTAVGRRQTWNNWFGSETNRIGTPAASDLVDKDWEWRAYQHGEAILSRQMSPPRGRFEGRIDLFVSQELIVSDRALRWREQATLGAEVLALPGKHSTYLIDGAPLIAEHFRRRLQALEEPSGVRASLSPPSSPGLPSSF